MLAGSSALSLTRLILEGTQNGGVALAAAAAQRGNANTAATTPELVEQCECQAVTANADRVAESDCSAVDVDFVGVDPELCCRCDTNSGERLVQLEKVEIGNGDAGLLGGEHRGSAGLMQE